VRSIRLIFRDFGFDLDDDSSEDDSISAQAGVGSLLSVQPQLLAADVGSAWEQRQRGHGTGEVSAAQISSSTSIAYVGLGGGSRRRQG
jgi:hypothetical protein